MKFILFIIFLFYLINFSNTQSCQSLIYKCCNGTTTFTANTSALSCCNRAPYNPLNDMVHF